MTQLNLMDRRPTFTTLDEPVIVRVRADLLAVAGECRDRQLRNFRLDPLQPAAHLPQADRDTIERDVLGVALTRSIRMESL